MNDDICSSDLEYEKPANPFASAGSKSIRAIILNGEDDRLKTKKAVKELTDVRGRLASQYGRTL